MAYKDLVKDILKTNDAIRFATVCDLNGNIAGFGHHQSVKNLLTFNESMTLLKLAAKSWKARNIFSSKIGKGKYAIATYEKIHRITIGFGDDHLIYLTADADSDHQGIIKDIIKIKEKYLKEHK